jgi:hypothetical protein
MELSGRHPWYVEFCAALLGVLFVARAAAAPAACIGDCDDNGTVAIDELLAMVLVALDTDPVSRCSVGDANQDGRITVDEILAAVNAALRGCPLEGPAATEAALGVESSTRDSLNALKILDFGVVGTGAGAAGEDFASGGAAGLLPTDCPKGGAFKISACDATRTTSTLTGTFSKCSRVDAQTGAVIVLDGKLRQTVADAGFCKTLQLSPRVAVTLELTDFAFTRTDASGETITRIAGLTDASDPGGQDCAGTNRKQSVDGGVHVLAEGNQDAFYTYRTFTVATESFIESPGGPCLVRQTTNGSLTVDDRFNRRSFSASLRRFAVTSQQSDTFLLVDESGGLVADCLGDVQFETLKTLAFRAGAFCPQGGTLQVAVANGITSSIGFSPNGVAFDFDGDGRTDKSVTSCQDAGLNECGRAILAR